MAPPIFMWGRAPIRRTLDYLKSGTFIAKDPIKIMEVHYSLHGRRYEKVPKEADYFSGIREFYFWEMPRIQYKNPGLQIVRILDKMPSPFIRFWSEDGTELIVDCFFQSRDEILTRIVKTAGKSKEMLEMELKVKESLTEADNPALFGYRKPRFCGCEVMGQHPCPGVIRVPTFDQLEVDIGGKIV